MTYPTSENDQRPRAVVFAVLPGGEAAAEADAAALAEIKELLASADIDWAADVVQHRDKPHLRSYLFPGKLTELKDAIRREGATVAVCEDDLSPAQVAAVLDAVDQVDVLDRTELILSVFARARSLARGHPAGASRAARIRVHAHARQGHGPLAAGRRRGHARTG